MPTSELRARQPSGLVAVKDELDLGGGVSPKVPDEHPAGPPKHGVVLQNVRMVLFVGFFITACSVLHAAQFMGSPLYLISKPYYYAWMTLTKQGFGLLLVVITEWFASPLIRVTGDKSVRHQIKRAPDGRLQLEFPERMVMIANHQIYTDWIYLWWASYCSKLHGHIYIILKESLKYIPIIGPGMMFYGFIFMARNWGKDKPRIEHRLKKLKRATGGPMSGSNVLDPMWLLIFPEGTNLSDNGRAASKRWADKTGLQDMRHQMLPRSTGLQFCLQQLKGTVEWVYDCTIHYEGIPPGGYGQDIFTLRSTYFQGQVPKSVNLYWRRFAVSSIPLDDAKEFEVWLRDRWTEKDLLLEYITRTGNFPDDIADIDDGKIDAAKEIPRSETGYVETRVKQSNPFEFVTIFTPVGAFVLVLNVIRKLWLMFWAKH